MATREADRTLQRCWMARVRSAALPASYTTNRDTTTGGVRKLRWGLEGRGKRGGARLIYFHHDADMPLFALTAYAKNESADLDQQDRNNFKRLTAMLVESFRRKRP